LIRDIAARDAELRQEALESSARLAHQNAADDALVLGGVLADDQHAGGAIQASTMKNRSPFDAESLRRIDIRARVVGTQRLKWFVAIAQTDASYLLPLPLRRGRHGMQGEDYA